MFINSLVQQGLTVIDSRKVLNKDDEVVIDFSGIYSLLSSHLWQTDSIRQFSLVSETMVMMLRSKVICMPVLSIPI